MDRVYRARSRAEPTWFLALRPPNLKEALASIISVYAGVSFFVVAGLATDGPHMDEWEWFNPGGIPSGWRFLFARSNEHLELFTYALAYVNYLAFGLDFRLQLIGNLIFYGFASFAIWRLLARRDGRNQALPLVLFLPFVSALAYENHVMSEQNHMHLAVLGLVLVPFLLFVHQRRFAFAGTVSALLVVSYGGAVASTLAFAGILAWRAARHRTRASLLGALTFAAFALAAIAFWLQGYEAPRHHPPPLWPLPWNLKFLRGTGEILALGFGFSQHDPWLAGFFLAFCSIPVWVAVRALATGQPDGSSGDGVFPSSALMGTCATLALVVAARGGWGAFAVKASRYAEIAMLLPLLCYRVLESARPTLARPWGWTAAALLVLGLSDDFGFDRYRTIHETRTEALACVKAALDSPSAAPALCPGTYPGDLRSRLEEARRLGVGFTRPATSP